MQDFNLASASELRVRLWKITQPETRRLRVTGRLATVELKVPKLGPRVKVRALPAYCFFCTVLTDPGTGTGSLRLTLPVAADSES